MDRHDPPRLIRVLLVDDSPEFLATLLVWARAQPELLVVGGAASGDEALDLVERLRPDVVTLDVSMPGKSGFDTARSIKARPAAPGIVMVSMYLSNAVRREAKLAGADAFLDKGSIVESLLDMILTVRRQAAPQ